jgi:TRAP-type uncharacterized transport system substrate-binding protein
MATGPPGGAYADVGARYREILGRSGIELRLVPTAGAVENLARLRDPHSAVSAGFVQAGTVSAQDADALASLGTVFYEPLWLFCRGLPPGAGVSWLVGKRVSIGPEGSGTRRLALRLLALNGVEADRLELLALSPEEAGDTLLRGEIAAAAILTSWDAPVVRRLLATPDVTLANFPRADAYVALDPFMNKVVVPTGVGDLANNRPPVDTALLAPKASLAVRRELHPALQYLLLEAASEVHAAPGIFNRAAQFPAPETIDLPLSDEARQFYKTGRPWLQRNLPLGLAVFLERLLILLIPIVGVVYPALRLLPPLYAWTMQRRIVRLYGELKLIEADLDDRGDGKEAGDLVGRLDGLERSANQLRVPVLFSATLYTLKHHIGLVRQRLERRPDEEARGSRSSASAPAPTA